MGAAVDAIWSETSGGELPMVAARDWWTAANVGFYAESRPSTLYLQYSERTPWSSDDELAQRGGVLVERIDRLERSPGDLAAVWRQRFPAAGRGRIVTIPWHAPGDLPPAQFLVMPVPPAGARDLAPPAVEPRIAAGPANRVR